MKKAMMMLGIAAVMLTTTTGCKKTCDDWNELEDKNCVEMRQKFYGTYTGTVTANGQSQNAQTVISQGNSGVNSLIFLLQTGNSTLMLTDESGAFTIALQNIYYQGVTMSIEGSGSFNGNQLVMNYVGSYQGSNTIINFSGTK
jgi:hypothetical protein